METLEQIRELFKTDRFATDTGVEIVDAASGYARCRLEVRPEHKNAGGIVMGGVVFTLADLTFAVASNTGQPATITMDSSITYLSSTRGTVLYAESSCVKAGHKTCCYDITVTDDLGEKIAVVRSNGFRVSDKPLAEWERK